MSTDDRPALPEPDARGLGQWVKSIALKDGALLTHDGQWWALRRDGELIRHLNEYEGEFIDAAVAQRDEQIERLAAEVKALTDSNGRKADRIDRLGETVVRLSAEVEALRAKRVPLTDGQVLACVRAVGTPAPMGLTRDRGPYEVTGPSWFLVQLVRAIERAHGIDAARAEAKGGPDA